jgi:hypothetical protein
MKHINLICNRQSLIKFICKLKRALYGIKCVLNRAVIPLLELSFLTKSQKVIFRVETKILVSMSEEITNKNDSREVIY